MAKKRMPSPTEDDINRIAEAIHNIDTFKKIKDKDSFKKSYDDYFEGDIGDFLGNKKNFDKVWGNYSRTYKDDLEEEKEQVQTRKSQRSIPQYQERPKREFTRLGKVKERIEYTEETQVTIKGKSCARLRDKRGRFASPKRPQKR